MQFRAGRPVRAVRDPVRRVARQPRAGQHAGLRSRSGAFWQDGSETTPQTFGFTIYPGKAKGRLGHDILLVDSLDPGLYETYRGVTAVIAKSGGRLSHGATLLRELCKPSAVMPQVSDAWRGQWVCYDNGQLHLLKGNAT